MPSNIEPKIAAAAAELTAIRRDIHEPRRRQRRQLVEREARAGEAAQLAQLGAGSGFFARQHPHDADVGQFEAGLVELQAGAVGDHQRAVAEVRREIV